MNGVSTHPTPGMGVAPNMGVAGRNGYSAPIREVLQTTFAGIRDSGDQMPIGKFEFWFNVTRSY